MKQQSPMLRLWELGEGQQGGLKRAVLSAVVGVLFGMLPYFAVAQMCIRDRIRPSRISSPPPMRQNVRNCMTLF